MKPYFDKAQLAFLGGSTAIFALIAIPLFWLFCLNHLSVQSVGIAYNSWTGKITTQIEPGWHVTSVATRVAEISTLPIQVCLFAGSRITNCKLVRFRATPEGIDALIRQQGFRYYSSTVNCNTPDQVCGGMGSVLKGYAFSEEEQPFLEIIREENLKSGTK